MIPMSNQKVEDLEYIALNVTLGLNGLHIQKQMNYLRKTIRVFLMIQLLQEKSLRKAE